MLRRLCSVSLLTLFSAGISSASIISYFDLQLGTWNGTTFQGDFSEWNTNQSLNWGVGITNPVLGSPLLYTTQTSDLALATGHYYLFMAFDNDPAPAAQLTVGLEGGGTQTAVFVQSDASSPVAGTPGGWTNVSGGGFSANLLLDPQLTYNLMAPADQTYTPSSRPNFVVDFAAGSPSPSPEPASGLLLGFGVAAIWVARRKLRRAA